MLYADSVNRIAIAIESVYQCTGNMFHHLLEGISIYVVAWWIVIEDYQMIPSKGIG